VPSSAALFAHRTPIRAFALADPNVAYPRDSMIDLERSGVIGRYADHAISMVGRRRQQGFALAQLSGVESRLTSTRRGYAAGFEAYGVRTSR
jgi:hypothetical protein